MKPLSIEQFAKREQIFPELYYRASWIKDGKRIGLNELTGLYLQYLLDKGGVLPSDDEMDKAVKSKVAQIGSVYHQAKTQGFRYGCKWATEETRNRLEDILK